MLYAETSSHFKVVKSVISAVAKYDPAAALGLIGMANTEERRDRAYTEMAKILVKSEWSKAASEALKKSVSLIAEPEIFEGAIVGTVEALSLSDQVEGWLDDVSSLAARARDPRAVCSTAIVFIKLAQKNRRSDIESLHIRRFREAIETIDSLYSRVDLYFELAATVAAGNESIAAEFYDLGVALRETSYVSGESSGLILRTCIALLARVFRPLMKVGELPDSHLDRFYKLTDQLPCTLTRAYIYCDLACRAWCEGRLELCSKIVTEKCKPLINDLGNPVSYLEVCEAIFPALYCTHRASAFVILDKLSVGAQQAALMNSAELILRKAVNSEPHDDFDEHPAKITYEDLVDICEMLERSPTDSFFYKVLKSAVTTATHKINKNKLSGQQKSDFASKVSELISKKLPDKRNIAHQGFVVVARGQILRLLDTRYEQWQLLIDDAESVPNLADKIYIFIELAKCIPTKFLAEKKRLLERARILNASIPLTVDKYERLEEYIRVARRVSPADAKAALKEAIKLTFDSPRAEDGARYRRNLVDIAEAIDSSVLDDIAEMVDDDPARALAKEDLKQSVEIHKLRRKIAAVSDKVDPESLTSSSLPYAAWKNV